ncbi:MAG: ribonuclease P protein subunit [Candidatus Diapherotrites archaeon]|nr:ribonuclease P protein subunit [Candidatus Diapherotrites archaeon]
MLSKSKKNALQEKKPDNNITPWNILAHELIGLELKIIGGVPRHNIGLTGQIVDETEHTIVIEDKTGNEKRFSKKGIIISLLLSGGYVELKGSDIEYKPEERIKKYWRKYHGRKGLRRQKLPISWHPFS